MRIAQVAPLYESVPPKLYGGTERVVHYLTEGLIRQGHEVTLFASGDSLTTARLVSPCETALRLDPRVKDPLAYHIVMLEEVFKRAKELGEQLCVPSAASQYLDLIARPAAGTK